MHPTLPLPGAKEAGRAFGETVSVVFIESICDEDALLEANMNTKVSSAVWSKPSHRTV